MKAMILAAGFGTRLRPITWTLPKPVVPVCNRPLMAWAVDNFLRAGIEDVIVNLHHLPDEIEHFLREEYRGRCHFEFSRETEILGTGGAIRKVRRLLESDPDFFLANGDTIQFPQLEALRNARETSDALAALTLRHVPAGDTFTAVYFQKDASQSGDPQRGIVTGFGSGTGEALMFSGCHCISTRIFRHLPDRDFSGIVEDVYQPMLANGGESLAAIVDDGLWFDIGKPQRYLGASRGLLEEMVSGRLEPPQGSRVAGESLVAENANVTGSIERSTVGDRTVIEGRLRDSFVWEDCRIARGAQLTSCIVAHGVEIARPMALENSIICIDDPAIPRDAGYRFEDGLAIAKMD